MSGNPISKQSFRKTKTGGYADPRVKAWQEAVGYVARKFIEEPLKGNVGVKLFFFLETKRVVDLDNLSKGVLDGLKKIAFEDDRQVTELYLHKEVLKNHVGVHVVIEALP